MASIIIGNINGGGGSVNPTTNFIPVNGGGYFKDSSIYDDGIRLYAEDLDGFGFEVDYDGNVFKVGDVNLTQNQTLLSISDNDKLININAGGTQTNIVLDGVTNVATFYAKPASNYLQIDGNSDKIIAKSPTIVFVTDLILLSGAVTAPAAGALSGNYLLITINSTDYKIPLYNP